MPVAQRDRKMTTDIQGFFEFIKEFFFPVGGPAAGALIGYAAAMKKNNAEARKALAEADAIGLNAATEHFEALINGYKKRIDDLTDEVKELRAEIKNLRKALDARPRPHYD